MKFLLTLWMYTLSIGITFAQNDFCSSSELEQAIRNKDSLRYDGTKNNFWKAVELYRNNLTAPTYLDNPYDPSCENCLVTGQACPKTKFVVPVVVHVVYNNNVANISTNQILHQLDVLNKHFSNQAATGSPAVNTGIQFVLANIDIKGNIISGITRHQSSLANHKKILETAQLMQMGISNLPMNNYMHIWIVESIQDNAGLPTSIKGYSTMPGSSFSGLEGIVITYDWFGDYTTYGSPLDANTRGNTLTHEVGHYLGLLHPFEGGCIGLNSIDCSKFGDKCCDVPAVSGQNQSCAYSNSCTEFYNNNPPDQKQNYMDYSLPSCKNTFTPNQTEIMHTTLMLMRQGLWQPQHINRMTNTVCLLSATFSSKTNFMCKFNGSNAQIDTFTAYAINGATYRWKATRRVNNVYVNYKNQYGASPIFTLNNNDTGNYTVSLTVYGVNDSILNTVTNVLRVEACGSKMASYRGNWEFGTNAGLGFYNGGKVYRDLGPYNNQYNIDAEESSITMNDSSGNLLFYGSTQYPSIEEFNVFGYNYKLLPGSPIQGYSDGLQQAVALPVPDSTNYYFIVNAVGSRSYSTGTAQSGYKYSIIRANPKNHSKDSVTYRKNIDIKDNQGRFIGGGESVTAIRHCNNKQYWILCKGEKDTVYKLLSKSDLSLSYVGYFLCGEDFPQCAMNPSPDGKLISIGRTVWNFNRSNGNTSFMFRDSALDEAYSNYGTWGSVFSNDNKILYRSYMNYNSTRKHFAELYQYNLESSANDKSRKKLFDDYDIRTMQNGPDSRIYLSVLGMPFVSVMNQPDKLSNGSDNAHDYQFHGPDLGEGGIGGYSGLDLPNFANTSIPSLIKPDFSVVVKNCKTVEFKSNQSCNKLHRWFFGTGDSSRLESPEYTYNVNGKYSVKLIIGKDTVKRTLTLELPKADYRITGDTLICDSNQIYEYKVGTGNDLTYNWSCLNCASTIPNKDRFETRWNGQGKIRVTIKDRATGCVFKDSLPIKFALPILNNQVSNDTLFCKNSGIIIKGTQPTGGTNNFSYQWYKSKDGKTWEYIKDSSRRDLYTTTPDMYFYSRKVYDICGTTSNITKKAKFFFELNTIKTIKLACLKGKVAKFKTTSIKTNIKEFYYVWQYSSDNVNWSNDNVYSGYYPTDSSKLHQYSRVVNSKMYIRRKISGGNCDEISNVIVVAKPIEITKHPEDDYVCHIYTGGGNRRFSLKMGLNLNGGQMPRIQWQYNSNGQWVNTSSCCGFPSDSSLTQENGAFSTVSPGSFVLFRCLLISCNDTISTNVATINFTGSTSSTFVKLPKDAFGTSTSPAIFEAKSNNAKLSWQKSTDRGKTWSFIAGQHDTTLSVNVQNLCAPVGGNTPLQFDRIMYRAYLNNGCSQATSGHVFPYYGNLQPIIRDDIHDKGKEPSDTIIKGGHLLRNPMLSPDIAVSFSQNDNPFISGYTDFMLNPTVGTNYIWVRVKNRGTQTSSPTYLDLHWSMTSTGLKWTQNWTANSRNMYYNWKTNQSYPMGGKINSTQIQVPSIAPGQVAYIMYAWNPTNMPNPSNYYQLVKKKKLNLPIYYYDTVYHPVAQNVTLLARMPHCVNIGNNMSFVEGLNTNENCRLNNRIAAKNLILSIIKPNMGGPGEVYATDYPVIIKNAKDSGDAILKLRFMAGDVNVGNIVRVVATMDSVLEQKWSAGGSVGSGFNMIEPHRLEITDLSNFTLENITLDTVTQAAIYFDFYLKPVPTGNGTSDYTFDFWQMSDKDSMPEGYVRFILQAPNYVLGHNFGDARIIGKEDISSKALKNEKVNDVLKSKIENQKKGYNNSNPMSINAYPNPTGGKVTLTWNCQCKGPFKVELINAVGDVIYTLELNSDSINSTTIPMENFSDGVYTAKISSIDYSAAVKVTLIK